MRRPSSGKPRGRRGPRSLSSSGTQGEEAHGREAPGGRDEARGREEALATSATTCAPAPAPAPPRRIGGRTRLLGVIGDPVDHSLSPAIHNAFLESAGIDAAYLPMPVSPGDLEIVVRAAHATGVVGLSVTHPHKTAVMALLDQVSPDARTLNAVNTIAFVYEAPPVVNRPAVAMALAAVGHGSARTLRSVPPASEPSTVRARGINTDGDGFCQWLERQEGRDMVGQSIVVLGAGAAARACIAALRRRRPRSLIVATRSARTLAKARALLDPRDAEAPDQATQTLCKRHNVPFIDLANYMIDPTLAGLLPAHLARRYQLVPLNKVGGKLTVAMADPMNILAIDEVQHLTQLLVKEVVATPRDIQVALDLLYPEPRERATERGSSPGEAAIQAPILVPGVEPAGTPQPLGWISLEDEGIAAVARALSRAELVVHATPWGLAGKVQEACCWPLDALHPRTLVVDLNYARDGQTPLLARLPVGVRGHDGAGMLVHQAALAFNLWFGVDADLEAGFRAIDRRSAPP